MTNVETRLIEQLHEAHIALLRDLQELDDASRSTSSGVPTELGDRLEATRKHIADHFRFEEENGYMDTVRKREPRFERTIEQLANEHRELAESLEAIIRQVRTAGTPSAGLREQVQDWVKRVRRHESRENSTIQNAFNLDISAED